MTYISAKTFSILLPVRSEPVLGRTNRSLYELKFMMNNEIFLVKVTFKFKDETRCPSQRIILQQQLLILVHVGARYHRMLEFSQKKTVITTLKLAIVGFCHGLRYVVQSIQIINTANASKLIEKCCLDLRNILKSRKY